MKLAKSLGNLLLTMVTSVLLLVLGIVYFMLTVFVVRWGAQLAGLTGVDGNMVLLTAGIVTAASLIGSALQQ